MDIIILEMVLSSLLTIATYLFIPALLIRRNKRTTKKKLLLVTIANGCLVFILWNVFRVVTNQEPNTNVTPAWLWSAIGYALMKKRLYVETVNEEVPYISVEGDSPVKEQKVDISPAVEPIDNMQTTTTKTKYCHKCGKEIDNKSKKCSGCGKQYFRWKHLIIGLLIIIPIAILASTSFYYYSECQTYQKKYIQAKTDSDQLKQLLEQREGELASIHEDIDELSERIYPMLDDIEFYHEHIVFRSDDNTELYHKYGCPRLDLSCFWAYNTEMAEQLGYEPCDYCSEQDYPVKATTREEFRKKYGY
jgi:hypothetical protein